MAILNCPQCQGELKEVGVKYQCPACDVLYDVKFTCDKCGSEPEEISGCGSVSYFCKNCNSLKSRSTMGKDFKPV